MFFLKPVLHYLFTAMVFFAIDLVWLWTFARNFYVKELGVVMADRVKWQSAIMFFCIYVVGILIFVVYPAVKEKSLARAMGFGAIYGLICYATFDLIGYALINGFSFTVVWVDMVWGTILTSVVSAISYFIVSKIKWSYLES